MQKRNTGIFRVLKETELRNMQVNLGIAGKFCAKYSFLKELLENTSLNP
jgi:hypothetical protein